MEELQVIEASSALAVSPELVLSIENARRWPRDLARFKDQLITAVSVDEETASMCFYSKPQDGGRVIGPSVRLAELAVASYGNISSGSRPGRVDRMQMSVTGIGFAMDLESNNHAVAEVTRPIRKKDGKTIYSEAMISTTLMAASAIARRNAIFQIIPRIYIDRACRKAQEIASGGDLPIGKRRENILRAFEGIGIERKRILLSLGVSSPDMITLGHILDMKARWTAIDEGHVNPEDAFPDPDVKHDRVDDLPRDVIEAETVE